MRALDHGCKSRWFHLGHSWAHCFTVNFLNYTSHSVSIISVYPLCVCEQVHLLASNTTSRQKKSSCIHCAEVLRVTITQNPEWLSSLPLPMLLQLGGLGQSAFASDLSTWTCPMKQEISEVRKGSKKKKSKHHKQKKSILILIYSKTQWIWWQL